MKLIKATFLLCLFFVSEMKGQYYSDPLIQPRKIPAEIIQTSTQKYDQSKIAHYTQDNSRTRRGEIVANKFNKQVNYQIDKMFEYGNVWFENEITDYAKKVVNVLLKDDQKLASEIKVYVVKSPFVNAFATDRKEIFINLGLFSKLKNESELAFILAHEIIHIKKRHSLSIFLKANKVDVNSEEVAKISEENRVFSQHCYSKDLEREADQKGFELFVNSGYSIADLDGVFEILKQADIPMAGTKINLKQAFGSINNLPEIFANPYDASFITEKESPTHPSVEERRTKIKEMLGELHDSLVRYDFIVSETEFQKIKKYSSLAQPSLYLLSSLFLESIYAAYQNKNLYPGQAKQSDIVLAKSLYKYQTILNHSGKKVNELYSETSGEMKVLSNFLSSFDKKSYSDFCVLFVSDLIKKYPADEELKALGWRVIYESNFFTKEYTSRETDSVVETEDQKKLSFFHDQLSKEAVAISGEAFYTELAKTADDQHIRRTTGLDLSLKEEIINEKFPKDALQLNSLWAMPSTYLKYHLDKEESLQVLESDQGRTNLLKAFQRTDSVLPLSVTILDVYSMDSSSLKRYQSLSVLTDYITELSDKKSIADMPTMFYEVQALAKENRYLLLSGVVNVSVTREWKDYYYIMLPIILPYYMIKGGRKHETVQFSVLYDLQQGGIAWKDFVYIKGQKDTEGIVCMQVYNTLRYLYEK